MGEQTSLALLGNVKREVRRLPDAEVAMCRCAADAIRLCMKRAYVQHSQEEWAEILGINKGVFSSILSYSPERKARKDAAGERMVTKHFDINKVGLLQKEAGNKAVTQWQELDTDDLLVGKREALARLEALEREAQQLRASL